MGEKQMAGPVNATEQWSSRLGFLLATVGFSVGLGNIWRFPYLTGENGGSAFLIVYLIFAFAIGLPLLISELSIGRRGRRSASGSIRAVAAEAGLSSRWGAVGGLAVICVFIILSYYSVITGWTLDYLLRAATGSFTGIDATGSAEMFAGLMGNPLRLLLWNTVVHVLVYLIVRRGVQGGVERAAKVLMPALFVALVVMVIYGAIEGDMAAAGEFLLQPDFSKITIGTVMIAIGQAFFSIGIAMGALITFGGYLPKDYSIPGSASVVIIADTTVAVLAGFAIFPLVFAFGLPPGSGSGLIFQTLPLAFGQMSGGVIFGSVFFVLLIAAALSSCIGCAEAVVSWVDEHWGIKREKGIILTVAAAWLVGILTILSLGDWSDVYPLDFIPAFAQRTIFDSLDFLAANILLLLGGFLTAVFFGWLVPKQLKLDEIKIRDGLLFAFWRFMIRFVVPPVLLIALVMGITE
jgi:NSS family neurotransmitter:Na+ symporter